MNRIDELLAKGWASVESVSGETWWEKDDLRLSFEEAWAKEFPEKEDGHEE